MIKNYICGVCRAGRLVIERSLVQTQIKSKLRTEQHVEVSLSKILNPTLLISEGPAMSWRLIQGVPCPALRHSWDWPKQQLPATPWISGYGQ